LINLAKMIVIIGAKKCAIKSNSSKIFFIKINPKIILQLMTSDIFIIVSN